MIQPKTEHVLCPNPPGGLTQPKKGGDKIIFDDTRIKFQLKFQKFGEQNGGLTVGWEGGRRDYFRRRV